MDGDFEQQHPRAGAGRFTEKPQQDPGSSVLDGRPPVQVKPGMEFTDARRQDLDWRPGPGQKYADGPLARMKVTARRNGRIYYTYANDPSNKGAWWETEAAFLAKYADQFAAAAPAAVNVPEIELLPGMRFQRSGGFGECEISKVTDTEVLFRPVGHTGASLRNPLDLFLARYGDQFR